MSSTFCTNSETNFFPHASLYDDDRMTTTSAGSLDKHDEDQAREHVAGGPQTTRSVAAASPAASEVAAAAHVIDASCIHQTPVGATTGCHGDDDESDQPQRQTDRFDEEQQCLPITQQQQQQQLGTGLSVRPSH